MPSEPLTDEELNDIERATMPFLGAYSRDVLRALAELRELRARERIERLERISDQIAAEDAELCLQAGCDRHALPHENYCNIHGNQP